MTATVLTQRVCTSDGISWHTETYTSPLTDGQECEQIILVPSGEGDCGSMANLANAVVALGPFKILTFDMPGLSRTQAPPDAYQMVTPSLLAEQMISLMDELEVQRASFFECSSGGGAILALGALYPSRVKCQIIHEVPFDAPAEFLALRELPDKQLVSLCQGFFAHEWIEQNANDAPNKWQALGQEYHGRLASNYSTWIRGYAGFCEPGNRKIAESPENLQRRPIFWTIGSLSPKTGIQGKLWNANFPLAEAAGLKIVTERLRCMHFPAVTIPEETAAWIVECVQTVE